MTSLRIRPRFRQIVEGTTIEIQDKIKKELAKENCPCKGLVVLETITLKIPENEQHFWTPQLNISLEKHNNNQTVVRGFYGPKPSVWSIFTFGYAIVGILSLFVLVYGTSQWMLNKDPGSLWGLLILGAVGFGLYLTAQSGQKLGAQQMFTLHHFYEKTLGVQATL